jgi:hypothetical protein
MTEHRTPDRISSRAPVHSVLVQKSVTTITNAAGRLSRWMLGKPAEFRKSRTVKSWHFTCQSGSQFLLYGTDLYKEISLRTREFPHQACIFEGAS